MNQMTTTNAAAALRDYTPGQLALVRKTVAADCNADEFDLFVEMCRRYRLDPFRKQIYAIVTNKNNPNKRRLAVVTAIDGYRSIASRSGQYRPDEEEPEYHYNPDLKDPASNPLGLERAVVRVWKQDSLGQWHKVTGSAHWEEFAPLKPGGKMEDRGEKWPDGNPKKTFMADGTYTLDPAKDNWRKMPRVMLAKCAEAAALRKGWPEDLGGLYVHEEMDQATTADLTASEMAELAEQEDRLKRINAGRKIAFQFDPNDEIQHIEVGEVFSTIERWLHDAQPIPPKVLWFTRTNRESLQQFWALAKNDALEIKRRLEAAALREPTQEELAAQGQ